MKQLTQLFLICSLFLFSGATMAQDNLLAGWDGNGATGTNSKPTDFGWECTNFNDAEGWIEANGGSAVRYMDNQAYLPSGRLLFVRWDGVGNASSVYSYPVQLEAGKAYDFSIQYTRHSNSTTNFVLGINSAKDNSGETLATGSFAPATQSFRTATFKIAPFETKTYYVTVGAAGAGMLGSITGLSMTETTPEFGCDKSSLQINFFSPEHTLRITSDGSGNAIALTAPTGIMLTPTSLPAIGGYVSVSSPEMVNTSGNIVISQGTKSLNIPVVSDYPTDFFPTKGIDTLTVDGAWCWFADPRAIYHKGTKEQTYFSWITTLGDIVVASYNHETGEYNQHTIWEKWQSDDHDNPSLLIRDDGRIIIFFAKHFGPPIKRYISTNPEDITSWGEEYELGNNVTYPYPFRIDKTIFVFYRGEASWKPHVVVSDDNGETFGTPREFVTSSGQRPYTRYCQGSDGSIHVAVTTGHPRNEGANKIYYCRFKDNKFYKADGTFIMDFVDTPINVSQMDMVYNGTSYGKGWIWDITLEPATGYPVMVYASFPSDTDHRYHYGRWNGAAWENTQITEAGKWFPQTPEGQGEYESNYSGGIIMDYDNPSVVYLSKEVNGTFEIFKFTTTDNGKTWSPKAITWNTPSDIVNVRPIVPRHHKEGFFDVIWMRGSYVFYANEQYHTALVFPEHENKTALTEMKLNSNKLELLKDDTEILFVNAWKPFLGTVKTVEWTTSDATVATVENGKVTAVGEGSATIKAISPDGVEAACEVTVKVPDYFFDFGTADSPLATGAIRIAENTLWNETVGYGWVSAVASRDRGASWSDEERDFCMNGNAIVFRVRVEDSEYDVQIKQGDISYTHDEMMVKVNDEIKLQNITANAGEVQTNTFSVEASNNLLNIEFSKHGNDANWVVNSLKLLKKEKIPTGLDAGIATDFENPETKMTVYDLGGHILIREKLGSTKIENYLQNKNLENGIYILQMELNEKKETRKCLLNNK